MGVHEVRDWEYLAPKICLTTEERQMFDSAGILTVIAVGDVVAFVVVDPGALVVLGGVDRRKFLPSEGTDTFGCWGAELVAGIVGPAGRGSGA